jgi:16S rRNA (uracil1498-N3)-methyltransferase
MPRFYYPQSLSIGITIKLTDALAHHIQVLRLAPGALVTLFNGEGGEYTATIHAIEKKSVSLEVKTFSPIEVELPCGITLAQALPEGSKMDWIIEKAVELGAIGIQPLSTQRSVVRLQGERAEKKRAHWQGVIVSASEQCGRNRLAHVAPLLDFQTWIGQQDLHRRILLTPRATQPLAEWARHHPPQAVTVMIGAEGGFSEAEENSALAHGALALSIGPRILRTETAGLAAIASLNAIWGGM